MRRSSPISLASRSFAIAAAVFSLSAFAACSGGLAQSTHPTQSTVVGTTGGTAPSVDGAVKLAVPSGAVKSDVTITVTQATSPPAGALGTVYEIGPTGTTFASPITITMSYAAITFLGDQASSVRVATYVGGTWQPLAGYAMQASAETVSATTSSLATYYALWFPSTSGSSPMCIDFSGGTQCSGSSSSNGGSSTTCTATTCAEAKDLCVSYPGSTLTCTDSSGGYEASCCFPSGQVCVTTSAAASCSGSSGSSSGAGSGSSSGTSSGSGGGLSCGAAPTCETSSDPCADTAGTTLKSCLDSTSGYTATCCYSPGVLPPSGGSSSGSSSGAGSGSGSSSGSLGGSSSSSSGG